MKTELRCLPTFSYKREGIIRFIPETIADQKKLRTMGIIGLISYCSMVSSHIGEIPCIALGKFKSRSRTFKQFEWADVRIRLSNGKARIGEIRLCEK
jgi:hypothetical protein